MGQHDRRRGRVRADGRRRDALAVLLAAARPQPAVRLRAGRGVEAQAPHLLELRQVLRRLREHRRVRAAWKSVEPDPSRAARPLARRADARVRRRRDRRLRELARERRDARLRGVSRRSLELVHPPLAPPVLGRGRGRAAHALVRARPDAARARADPPVRHRPPLADARPRRAGVGAPRRLARGRRAGSRAARRDRRGAARRRARAAGALELGHQAAAAAAPARRRGRRASTGMSTRSPTSCG